MSIQWASRYVLYAVERFERFERAHLGGTALMRDTSRLVALGRSQPVIKNEIRVYSPAGEGIMWFTVRFDCAYPVMKPNLVMVVGFW